MFSVKSYLFVFLLVNLQLFAKAQDSRIINISFVPEIDNQVVKLNEDIIIDSSEKSKIVITKLKFYVSHLSLLKDEKIVWQDKASSHLLDAENLMTIKFFIKRSIDFNKIRLGLGIDSISNVSGALDGDLDPLKGMYWTWQSGYVNFKLEGNRLSEKQEQKFEYHLGGYDAENNSFQNIQLDIPNSDNVDIYISLDKFLSNENVKTSPNIVSPGKKAVEFSKYLASCFKLK